jgi:hypothetical protein
MHDICIVDIDPCDGPGSVARIRDLVTSTDMPSVAFMVTAVPNEQPLSERLDDWVRRFIQLRDGLNDLPVQTGILVQALIGHGDRNRIVGQLPYQTIVGADGVACRESFCPLDTNFQEYTRQLIRTLAEAAPAFMMIDDDFRIAQHAPAMKGCMCPLHLDRFSRMQGISLTREDLISRLRADNCDDTQDQWEQLKEDGLVELASVIRGAIDSVDDSIPGSFCCVTSESHLAPPIVDILAGKHTPLVRINNAVYLENGHKGFPQRVTQTFHQIAQFPKDTTILTEADTCPHNRYSLSVKAHLAHITATTLAGCHGAKYWFNKADDEDGWNETAPFRQMLTEVQPYLNEVATIRDRVSWLGPAAVGRMAEILRKPWDRQSPMDFLSDDWGWRVFGRMGIPFRATDGHDANTSLRTLCRTAPLAYSTDVLTEFLSGSLLLDGEAAWHIYQRGLGKYLGIAVEPESDACAYELMHICPGSERRKELAINMSGDGRYRLAPQSDGVHTASSFVTGSPGAYNVVGPALTWYENERGGRVAVYGISMDTPVDWVFYNSKRKTQLLETLTWLADGTPPVLVETDLDVYMLHGKDNIDERTEYACLFNLNPDTIENVCITLPGKQVTRIDKLTTSGTWEFVDFSAEGQSVRCDVDARTMEPLILKLTG